MKKLEKEDEFPGLSSGMSFSGVTGRAKKITNQGAFK